MSKKIEVEQYQRVVGYYRPLKQANVSKQEEINERKLFDVNNKKKNYPKWNKKDLT